MLAMVGNGFRNSESETGGLVGGSSHEKSNPTDLTEIRLSQTQIRQDLARSSKISTRTIEICPILDKFVEIQPNLDEISLRFGQFSPLLLLHQFQPKSMLSPRPKTEPNYVFRRSAAGQTSYHPKWSSWFQVGYKSDLD